MLVIKVAEFVVAVVTGDREPNSGTAEAKFATKRIAAENKMVLRSLFINSNSKNRIKSTLPTENLVRFCTNGFVDDGQMQVEAMILAVVYGFNVM